MTEEKSSLHIDTDWKKQAQEEKKKLAEQEALREQPRPAAPGPAGGVVPPPAAASRASKPSKEMPPASFASLVQSALTQVLYYLGDLSPRGSEPQINLDMAKHHIDALGVIEEKTKGNLSPEEQKLLDAALYETRMRYVSVASQFMGP